MRSLPALVFLTVLCAPIAHAQDACEEAVTQRDLNECAALEAEAADAELNRVYRQTMARVEGASEARIRAGQRSWIAYRDAWCRAASGVYDGGSMRPMVHSLCLAELTRQQTMHLRHLDPERE